MYDDDSRGLESPDRPQASTDDWNTRVRPDGGDPSSNESTGPTHPNDVDPDAAGYRLEVIDHQAKRLLEELAVDQTGRGRPHEAVRHLREIRAEVEWARRGLCEWPASTETESGVESDGRDDAADSRDGSENSRCDAVDSTDDAPNSADDAADGKGDRNDRNEPHRTTADGIPMVVRRGPHVTTVLGPDPVAYERSLEAADRDESEDGDVEDGDDTEDADVEDGDDTEHASDLETGDEPRVRSDLEDADRETDADGDRDADEPYDDDEGDRDDE